LSDITLPRSNHNIPTFQGEVLATMADENLSEQSQYGYDKRASALSSGRLVDDDGAGGSGDHEADFVTENERNELKRGLHQRHIGLIALAGAIVCSILCPAST
jgi:amino acid permease